MRIHLTLLGAAHVSRGSTEHNLPQQLAALLGLLDRERPSLSRARALLLLWPDADSTRARRSLSQAIYGLRQILGDDAIVSLPGERIRLATTITSDVKELIDACSINDVDAALRLYRGDFLDGISVRGSAEFDQWVDLERQRIRDALTTSLAERMTMAAGSGDFRTAIRYGSELVLVRGSDDATALKVYNWLSEGGDRAGAGAYITEYRWRVCNHLELEVSDAVEKAAALSLPTIPPRKPRRRWWQNEELTPPRGRDRYRWTTAALLAAIMVLAATLARAGGLIGSVQGNPIELAALDSRLKAPHIQGQVDPALAASMAARFGAVFDSVGRGMSVSLEGLQVQPWLRRDSEDRLGTVYFGVLVVDSIDHSYVAQTSTVLTGRPDGDLVEATRVARNLIGRLAELQGDETQLSPTLLATLGNARGQLREANGFQRAGALRLAQDAYLVADSLTELVTRDSPRSTAPRILLSEIRRRAAWNSFMASPASRSAAVEQLDSALAVLSAEEPLFLPQRGRLAYERWVLTHDGGDLDTAEGTLREASRSQWADPRTWVNYTAVLFAKRDYRAAAAASDRARREDILDEHIGELLPISFFAHFNAGGDSASITNCGTMQSRLATDWSAEACRIMLEAAGVPMDSTSLIRGTYSAERLPDAMRSEIEIRLNLLDGLVAATRGLAQEAEAIATAVSSTDPSPGALVLIAAIRCSIGQQAVGSEILAEALRHQQGQNSLTSYHRLVRCQE